MGKRSNFERNPRDFYPTPAKAVVPLFKHLEGTTYIEPCAGDGALIEHLNGAGLVCRSATDIEPRAESISQLDAMDVVDCPADYIITNPPWDRKILHPMIEHFRQLAPTWLLFDGDWKHTKQAVPFLPYCRRVVSVGRLKWIPDSPHTGKDNCAWYLFGKEATDTVFIGNG